MVKTDCVHFPLDRPCAYHKERGIRCPDCRYYVSASPPVSSTPVAKVLVIKLGAMGDVLRTTFLLSGLKDRYPRSGITWVVDPVSAPILEHNPLVERVWPADGGLFDRLLAESFDVLVSLDLSPRSLALATATAASRKLGYSLDGRRRIRCSNAAAEHWLEMSAFDNKKRANGRTYQYWMAKIVGLPRSDYEIYTPLVKESVAKARRFARAHRLSGKTVVGINPGAGKRWRLKQWTLAGYREIIRRLAAEGKKVLLYGGPGDNDIVASLARDSRGAAISTGTGNPIPDFFALLDLSGVLITGDTLALHAALGLKKNVVAIFGPTSAPEIELYGRGEKVVSPVPCACCYRPRCTVKPDCMELISPDMVWVALQKQMRR